MVLSCYQSDSDCLERVGGFLSVLLDRCFRGRFFFFALLVPPVQFSQVNT